MCRFFFLFICSVSTFPLFFHLLSLDSSHQALNVSSGYCARFFTFLRKYMLRRVIQKALKALPKPPYADAFYWDKVYSETFQSQGAIEWGVPPALLFNYQCISENGACESTQNTKISLQP